MASDAEIETEATPEPAPARAPLSVDEAAGLLAAEPEGTAEEAAAPAGPEANDEAAPEGATAPAEGPASLSEEDRAWFAAQPDEVRERVLAWEAARNEAAAAAKAEAAKSKAAAEAEAKALADARGEIDRLLGEAQRRLGESGWEGIDWARWAAEDPAAALQGRIRFEQEQGEARRLAVAGRAAHDQAFRAFVAGEETRLAELAPDLASDTGKRGEIATYLAGQGYPAEALRNVSARDVVMARKAMLWDRAEAALKAPKLPAQPAPASKPVRASAKAPAVTPQRRAAEANSRFAQTRALDDAVAVLNANLTLSRQALREGDRS